jgi:hypothetical protein
MLVNLLISVFGKTKTMYSNAQRIPVQSALLWGGGCVMQERGFIFAGFPPFQNPLYLPLNNFQALSMMYKFGASLAS